MTPGTIARRLLGPRLFPAVGRWYRRCFVDLEAVVRHLPVRPGAHLLDVGGGDGALLDLVLAAHPDVRATLLDVSPRVGAALRSAHAGRVALRPATTVRDFVATTREVFDLVVVADVLHHVPAGERPRFLGDLAPLLRGRTALAIKDIRPGSLRATFGLLSDRYVSGDRGVRFLDEEELETLVAAAIPGLRPARTGLFEEDAPNYCVLWRSAGDAAQTSA